MDPFEQVKAIIEARGREQVAGRTLTDPILDRGSAFQPVTARGTARPIQAEYQEGNAPPVKGIAAVLVENNEGGVDQYYLGVGAGTIGSRPAEFQLVSLDRVEARILDYPELGGTQIWLTDPGAPLQYEDLKRLPEIGVLVPDFDAEGLSNIPPVIEDVPEALSSGQIGEDSLDVNIPQTLTPPEVIAVPAVIVDPLAPTMTEAERGVIEIFEEANIGRVPSLDQVGENSIESALSGAAKGVMNAIWDGSIAGDDLAAVVTHFAAFDEGLPQGMGYVEFFKNAEGLKAENPQGGDAFKELMRDMGTAGRERRVHVSSEAAREAHEATRSNLDENGAVIDPNPAPILPQLP